MMPGRDASLSDHEWRLKMATEGKAICTPGRTIAERPAADEAERQRQAARQSRTVTLTRHNWSKLDTAIDGVIGLLDDVRNVALLIPDLEGSAMPDVCSLARVVARAIDSIRDANMDAIDTLNTTIRMARNQEVEA